MILTPDDPQKCIDQCIILANKYSLGYGYNLTYIDKGHAALILTDEKALYGPFFYKDIEVNAIYKRG